MSEQPLNEYIDLEAYDVVTGETYRKLRKQFEMQDELIEEAHRFALALAELKVRTRPFAEAWLDKYHAYRASLPAKEPSV